MQHFSAKGSFRMLFLLLALTFLSFRMIAGEIDLNRGKNEVRFSGSSYQKTDISGMLSSIRYQDIQTPMGVFTELAVEGYGWSNTVGDPKLPVYHKLIEAPLNADFNITFGNVQFVDYDLSSFGINHPVIPAQAPLCKNVTDPSQVPFVMNSSAYQKDEFTGNQLVTVEPVGIMRSVNMANLTISPILYNPVTHKIRVYTSLEVTVNFTNGDIAGTILLREKKFSPFFGKLIDQLPNHQPDPDQLITAAPATLVIVAPRDFEGTLKPFVDWKTQKGFKVIEAYTDDPAVGNNKTTIRSYLMGLYNTPPAGYDPPSFIILAGDIGQVPTFTLSGGGSSHPSDLSYAEYTNDHIPEVFYGRFAAQNLTQLQAYIDKTLEYEQYTMPVDTFLNEVVMVAGAQSGMETYTNGQINYGTNTYFNAAHNLTSHTYLQPELPGSNYSQKIRNNVSAGVGFADYTAHGSESGWADPAFSISHISALQNAHKYPLMVGNCCKTSNFSVTCFAKEITRAANKGALGYIGCSDYSYWDEDYWWACGFKTVTMNPPYNAAHLGAFDKTFHDHGEALDDWFVTMGQMTVGGDLAVQESSSSLKIYYWETYCLMGDPSLSVYYSVPQPVAATYPESLPVGTAGFYVTTEPYAYVSVSVHDSVFLDAKCADSTGLVEISFDTISEVCNLKIVISKQNRKPILDSIPVVPFVLNPEASADTICSGSAVQLNVTVTGGSGNFTYLWAPSDFLNDPAIANPVSVPGNNISYTVTVDDGTYPVTSSPILLTVLPSPEKPVISQQAGVLVSSSPDHNQWFVYQQLIPDATGQEYTPVVSGDYSVQVTDPVNGCSMMSEIFPYYFTGSSDLSQADPLSVYPNPAKDLVTISYFLQEPGNVTLSVFNTIGREISTPETGEMQSAGRHQVRLDGKSLGNGIYYIRLKTDHSTVSKKLIISN